MNNMIPDTEMNEMTKLFYFTTVLNRIIISLPGICPVVVQGITVVVVVVDGPRLVIGGPRGKTLQMNNI